MLYPDFNELMNLRRSKGKNYPFSLSPKTKAPGNHHTHSLGRGMEFDSVREYVLGDDIRNIDWRVTARTGSPHLKLFREEKERNIVVCVDMNSEMQFGTKNTFKSVQAARAAALLGWQTINNQDRFKGCLYGDVKDGFQFFFSKSTRKSLSIMLKTLSESTIEKNEVNLENLLNKLPQAVANGSFIYIISDFMNISDNLDHCIGLSGIYKKSNLIFISINDPFDKEIPAMGRVNFHAKNSSLNVDTSNQYGRENYQQKWLEHRQQLKEITSKYRIRLVELTTESNIQEELFNELKHNFKRKMR